MLKAIAVVVALGTGIPTVLTSMGYGGPDGGTHKGVQAGNLGKNSGSHRHGNGHGGSPLPLAGTGIPGLILAGFVYLIYARRRPASNGLT